MERIEELCCYYLALIRCVGLIHQNHHWVSKGKNFYGNHLLFERIYKTAVEDADLAAEKFVGLFGAEAIDLDLQAKMIGKIMESFSSGDPVETSLKAEEKFLTTSEKFYDALDKEGKLTLGVDDMVMAIASNREGAVYLLKQASIEHGSITVNPKLAARKKLLSRVLAQKTNITDPTELEHEAEVELKKYISMALIRIAKGNLIGFNLRLERPGADFSNYSLRITLPQGAENFVQPLQEQLPAIADRVPYFKGRIKNFTVNIAS